MHVELKLQHTTYIIEKENYLQLVCSGVVENFFANWKIISKVEHHQLSPAQTLLSTSFILEPFIALATIQSHLKSCTCKQCKVLKVCNCFKVKLLYVLNRNPYKHFGTSYSNTKNWSHKVLKKQIQLPNCESTRMKISNKQTTNLQSCISKTMRTLQFPRLLVCCKHVINVRSSHKLTIMLQIVAYNFIMQCHSSHAYHS